MRSAAAPLTGSWTPTPICSYKLRVNICATASFTATSPPITPLTPWPASSAITTPAILKRRLPSCGGSATSTTRRSAPRANSALCPTKLTCKKESSGPGAPITSLRRSRRVTACGPPRCDKHLATSSLSAPPNPSTFTPLSSPTPSGPPTNSFLKIASAPSSLVRTQTSPCGIATPIPSQPTPSRICAANLPCFAEKSFTTHRHPNPNSCKQTMTSAGNKDLIANQKMTKNQQPALALFVIGLVGLGVLALRYADYALVWQPVPAWVPARAAVAYGSGALMLALGIGLLFPRTQPWSVRVLFPYLVLWSCLKLPDVITAPGTESSWLGLGELTLL